MARADKSEIRNLQSHGGDGKGRSVRVIIANRRRSGISAASNADARSGSYHVHSVLKAAIVLASIGWPGGREYVAR